MLVRWSQQEWDFLVWWCFVPFRLPRLAPRAGQGFVSLFAAHLNSLSISCILCCKVCPDQDNLITQDHLFGAEVQALHSEGHLFSCSSKPWQTLQHSTQIRIFDTFCTFKLVTNEQLSLKINIKPHSTFRMMVKWLLQGYLHSYLSLKEQTQQGIREVLGSQVDIIITMTSIPFLYKCLLVTDTKFFNKSKSHMMFGCALWNLWQSQSYDVTQHSNLCPCHQSCTF